MTTFKKGQRVKLTTRGVENFSPPHFQQRVKYTPDLRGTVTTNGHDPEMVCVLRDGLKTATYFHSSFWEVVQEEKTK